MLLRKLEEKRQFERLRHKWEDSIKMRLKETVGVCGLNSCGSE
jgi:hypothetical protein